MVDGNEELMSEARIGRGTSCAGTADGAAGIGSPSDGAKASESPYEGGESLGDENAERPKSREGMRWGIGAIGSYPG